MKMVTVLVYVDDTLIGEVSQDDVHIRTWPTGERELVVKLPPDVFTVEKMTKNCLRRIDESK
jgi:hypothetical protein